RPGEDLDGAYPGTGEDLEAALGDVPGPLQVRGQHPHPVPAHLGDRAVGVAVVHEPLRAIARGVDPGAVGADGTDHAVPADAGAPIGEGGDGGRVEVEQAVGVVDHHEVVLGAVALGEVDAHAHPPSLRLLRTSR